MSYVKRTDNEDKILKLLQQNRTGIKIKDIEKKLDIDHSTVYRNLNSLELRELAHYERGIAYPRASTKKKSPRFGLFEWLNRRAERKRLERERAEKEALADQWSAMENIAEAYPEQMGFWKDIAEKEKKNRKELGLE